jgi:hypothetical protein
MALCWEDGVEPKGGLACSHNTIRISFHRGHMMLQCRCNCSDSTLCIKPQCCCKPASSYATRWKCNSCSLPIASGMHTQHTQMAFACNA